MRRKLFIISLSVLVSACTAPPEVGGNNPENVASFHESSERVSFSLKVNKYYPPSDGYIGMCNAVVESLNQKGTPVARGFTIDDLSSGFKLINWNVVDDRDHFHKVNRQKVEDTFRNFNPTRVQKLDQTFTSVKTAAEFADERSRQYEWYVDNGGEIFESQVDLNGDGSKEHVIAILMPRGSDLPINYDRGNSTTNPYVFAVLDERGYYDPAFKAIEGWSPFLHNMHAGVGLADWGSSRCLDMRINYVHQAVGNPRGVALRRSLCEIRQNSNNHVKGNVSLRQRSSTSLNQSD